jgi:precorrin-2/cobalt-factor-2 C20-methyltransferase
MREMNEHYPDIQVEVVPGISSVNGAAARLGFPLADGDEVFAIVPATEDWEAMKQALLNHDAVVFIKVAKVIDQMVDLLTEIDLIEKAAVVTRVTSDEEKIFRDVAALKGTKLDYLSLMVVRK